MKKLLFSAIATASMIAFTAPSQAFTISGSGSVGDGATDYSFNSGFAPLPAQVGAGTVAGTLNTSTLANGFNDGLGNANSLFSTPFGRLGSPDNTLISAGAAGTTGFTGTTNFISFSNNTITFTAFEVANLISLTFDYAFNGTLGGGNDQVQVSLTDGMTDFLLTGINLNTILPNTLRPGIFVQGGNLLPGTLLANTPYLISLSLIEGIGGGNSAFGFDNLAVTVVPFEFSPALGVLGLAGLFGANQFRKKIAKRKQAVDVNSIG